MESKRKNTKTRKTAKADKNYAYMDEQVLNYNFSDFVKVNSFPRGLMLSFGKWHPEKNKFLLFNEVLLPFEVAQSLGKIIENQIDDLTKKGLIEFVEIKKDE